MDIRYNPWIRFLFPVFLTLYLGFLLFLFSQFREPPRFEWYALFWFGGTIFLLWESGWRINQHLDRKWPFQKSTSRRLMLQFLYSNAVGILLFLLLFVLFNAYENLVLGHYNPLSPFHLLIATAQAFLIVQIINSVQIGYALIEHWQAARLEAALLHRRKAASQLAIIRNHYTGSPYFGLSSGVDPTLSTIDLNPENAYEVYREALGKLDQKLADVQRELDAPGGDLDRAPRKAVETRTKNRFLVRSGPKWVVVPTEEIAGFFTDQSTFLLTRKGKKYPVDFSLDEALSRLPGHSFFRVNRQCVLNVDVIQEIRPEANQIQLTLSLDFPVSTSVSQRSRSAFRAWLREE